MIRISRSGVLQAQRQPLRCIRGIKSSPVARDASAGFKGAAEMKAVEETQDVTALDELLKVVREFHTVRMISKICPQ